MSPDPTPASGAALIGLYLFLALLGSGCGGPDQPDAAPALPKGIAYDPDTLRLYFDLSEEHAETLIANNRQLVIIDIRAPEHYAAAHIANAINVPFHRAPDFLEKMRQFNRGTKLLIYGYSPDYLIDEQNSHDAIRLLRQDLFRDLYFLTAGYAAWIQAGKPVVDAQGQVVAEPPLGPMPEPLPETVPPAAK